MVVTVEPGMAWAAPHRSRRGAAAVAAAGLVPPAGRSLPVPPFPACFLLL
jgi:hypothetical protein